MDCHGAGLDLPGDLLPGKVQAREVEGSGRAGGKSGFLNRAGRMISLSACGAPVASERSIVKYICKIYNIGLLRYVSILSFSRHMIATPFPEVLSHHLLK